MELARVTAQFSPQATALALACFFGAASADTPAVRGDYLIESPDGRYVFVMKRPHHKFVAAKYRWTRSAKRLATFREGDEEWKRLLGLAQTDHVKSSIEKRFARKRAIDGLVDRVKLAEQEMEEFRFKTNPHVARETLAYPRTGMYAADDPSKPLWTFDQYAQNTEIANDGKHWIWHGPWASSLQDPAFAFYAEDKLLSEYLIADLVENPDALKYTISHFFWTKRREFDANTLTYSLETADGIRYVFDGRTGEMVSKERSVEERYDAMLVLADGSQLEMSGLRACKGDMFRAFTFIQHQPNTSLFGFTESKAKPNLIRPVVIPIGQVNSVGDTKILEDGKISWRVNLRDGSEVQMLVREEDEYCGMSSDKSERKIHVRDIIGIYDVVINHEN